LDVARSVCFLVVSRPGHTYEIPAGMCVERVDTLEIPVSSSAIRRTLAAGGMPEGIPSAVLSYAIEHKLY
jgi:nicotinic acid mononucleotide adenylyltransferase